MANINYRIKEINQKVSKDYAIQFDIGKKLKENLKIYDIHRSKSKDFFSNYEEEETKNFAINGVLYYASYFCDKYDVIATAVSGQSKLESRVFKKRINSCNH